MDFSFTPTQQAVSTLARRIFSERVTPATLEAADAGPDGMDRRLWAELGATGLLGTAIPETEGGSGQGLLELCALLVEAGAAVAPVPLWATLVTGALPVSAFGSAELRRRLLPGVATGELFLTAALAEVGPADPTEPSTIASREGNRWWLSGVRGCVPAGHLATRILVPARTPGGAVGLFLLDPRARGVALAPQRATTGELQSHLTLSEAPVAPEDVLVEPGPGGEALEWLLERATVALCALELGVAERALRMTAAHTTSRHQFERPLATFQAVAQRAADAYVDVEAIRLTLWKAASLLAAGHPAAEAVATAKVWAAEAGHRVVCAAQHLHGGIGFDTRYPLYRCFLWSKQIELSLGSATVHLARLGARLAGG